MESSLISRLETATIQGTVFLAGVWLICTLLKGLPAVWKCWLWRLVPVKFALALVIAVSVPLALPHALAPVAAPARISVAAPIFRPITAKKAAGPAEATDAVSLPARLKPLRL